MQNLAVQKVEAVDPIHVPAPIEDLLELRSKNLSLTQAGKVLGISKQAVSQRLQRAQIKIERLQRFKKHRGDVFAQKQVELIDALTPDDIKGMNGRDKVVATGILYDKERLERGQSTANIGIHTLVSQHEASLTKLREQRAALEVGGAVRAVDGVGLPNGDGVVEATEDGGGKP